MMRAYLQYLWSVLRHKWFVMLECFKVGLIWRGITHDWTKFLPDEFIPYARHFYGNNRGVSVPPDTDNPIERAFIFAWNRHQKRHDHHWQFWLLTEDNPSNVWRYCSHDDTNPDVMQHADYGEVWLEKANYGEDYRRVKIMSNDLINTPERLPMSDKARKEMLADWRGAGRAYGNPDTRSWYMERRYLMEARLHPDTREWIEEELDLFSPGRPLEGQRNLGR
jgi:hypothetical protein